jgi:hypothetical protein
VRLLLRLPVLPPESNATESGCRRVAAASVLLIEGLGQQSYGSLNWGDGLITDHNTIARTGLSDPNPFFQELLRKPYRRQVIAAVHVYPPVISKVMMRNAALCQLGVT